MGGFCPILAYILFFLTLPHPPAPPPQKIFVAIFRAAVLQAESIVVSFGGGASH
jgi:hypothetical protein